MKWEQRIHTELLSDLVIIVRDGKLAWLVGNVGNEKEESQVFGAEISGRYHYGEH